MARTFLAIQSERRIWSGGEWGRSRTVRNQRAPVAGLGVFAYGGGCAGRAVVGSGLLGCRSGAAGGRLDGSCRAAAPLLQRGGRYDQLPRGGGRYRPVGDDGRAGGRGILSYRDGAGAEARRASG